MNASLEQKAVRTAILTGFQSIRPRFCTPQSDLLVWLVDAHARHGKSTAQMTEAFERYSASTEHIAVRGHELADFTHQRWDDMVLFGPKGSDVAVKTQFFETQV